MGIGRKETVGLRFVHEFLGIGDLVTDDGRDWRDRLEYAFMDSPRLWWRGSDTALRDSEFRAGQSARAGVVKLLEVGAIGLGIWAVAKLLAPSDARADTPDTPDGYLSREFDSIFAEECPGIPIEYLRALAKKESDLNPEQSKGGAWGLLQVTNSVRTDYNKLYGTNYSSDERLDPRINARMACELIGRISRFLPRQDPAAFDHGEFDWVSRRDVKIVTLAWNAGWSTNGVSGMIRNLLNAGYSRSKINAELILDQAHKYPEITHHLREWKTRKPRIKSWLNAVANYYFHELRAPSV